METEQHHRSRVAIAAVVILALLLVATVYYYNAPTTLQGASSASTISSLQSEVSQLQSDIASLQAQISTQGTPASMLTTTANAQGIFSSAFQSVVTIQGDVASTVLTFFGQRTSYSLALGSGFVTTYQSSNYIVTNFHVVDGMTNMTVTFTDGNAYPAKVVGTDPYSDLAVVSVVAPSSEFVPIRISESTGLQVGQPVFAIGSPFGLTGSFTSGVISQLGRTIQEATSGNYSVSGIIQFSVPINPGNSGGPLLDANGNVVGITTATVSGSQGLGFAIPSHTILKELTSLITTGGYKMHSYLGINSVDMNYQLGQDSHTSVTYGVLIEDVAPGSPAAKAGLKGSTSSVTVDGQQYLVGGDIIVSVNGTRIVNQDALSSYLEVSTVAGQTVVLGIVRNGTQMSVTITLGARP
jgi:S1-C subfamily serine protease